MSEGGNRYSAAVILVTAGYDHRIRFWEAPSGINFRTLRHESPATCLTITPNKQFLGAAGGHPAIRLYDINDTTNQNPVLTLDGHRAAVTSIGFQRDVRFLYSGSEDGTVKLWDLRSNTFSRSWDSKAAVNSVCLHPNQVQLISGDQDGSIKVWDIGSNRFINELVPEVSNSSYCQRASIQAVDLSEDGRTLIAATNHAEVFVWDPSNPVKYEPLAKFRAHAIGSYLLRARISPDCRSLVTTSSDRTARIWDISRNLTQGFQPSLSKTLAQHSKWVWDAVFSADSGYLVTASSDMTSRLWKMGTGDVVRVYSGHQSAVTCVALNDNST